MDSFNIFMILIGIALIIVSLIWIALDKKSTADTLKKLDDKMQEISAIVSDAEFMIEELNKVSEYIVGQIDQKNEELLKNLKLAENFAAADNQPEGKTPAITGTGKADKKDKILSMSNEGLDAAEIAKKLSMGKGEIQLILELNK